MLGDVLAIDPELERGPRADPNFGSVGLAAQVSSRLLGLNIQGTS